MRFYHIEIDMYQTDNYIWFGRTKFSRGFCFDHKSWISCFNFLFVTIFVIIDTRKAAMIKAIKNQNNGNIGPISLFNDYNNYVIKWINKQLVK